MGASFHRHNPSLRASYVQGLFACGMVGFSQEYFTPFLLFLGGTALQVGLLNAFNNFIPALVQLFSAELAAKIRSRQLLTLIFVFLQTLMAAFLAGLALWKNPSPIIFIASAALFTSLGAITHPCWLSLLSDLAPARQRGVYFGWRTRNLGFATIAATFTAGVILDHMEFIQLSLGFAALFALACVSRLLSFYYIGQVKEPPLAYKADDDFTIFQFFARFRQSNFVKFVVFVALMNFAVNLAAPFFAVYMLEDLHFNYLIFTIVNITAPAVLYLTIRRWGQHADHVGNLKALKATAPLIGFIPLLWTIHPNPFFLVCVEMFSGFLWAGFNLCSSNFIMDAVTPEKRTRCFAYFTFVNGLALAAGAALGGWLLKILPAFGGHKILTLLLISSGLRMAVGFLMPLYLKEVRPVKDVRNHELLFSLIGIKPIYGIERKTLEM